jgi:hypothetical protein
MKVIYNGTIDLTDQVRPIRVQGGPFSVIEPRVTCFDCNLIMAPGDWPSHYRTKAHREALRSR